MQYAVTLDVLHMVLWAAVGSCLFLKWWADITV
jgi:hypothetical protein